MRLFYLAVAAAVLVVGATASASAASVPIPDTIYSGSAGAGNSGADAFGNPWLWNHTSDSGASAWGTPGLGATTAAYGSNTAATSFSVTFNGGALPAIDQTASPSTGGSNEFTRFEVSDPALGQVAWSAVYTGPDTVTFYAPPGASLVHGESYFVNIIFDGATISGENTGFTAQFSVPGPVPGLGLASLSALALAGLYARARRA